MKRNLLFCMVIIFGLNVHALSWGEPIDDYAKSSPFMERATVMGGGDDTIHLGIDIVPYAMIGHPDANCKIYAAEDGEVLICYPPPGTPIPGKPGQFYQGHPLYGGCVVLKHWDNQAKMYAFSLYGHMKDVWVWETKMVKKGEPMGLVGSTGKSTGPHLHFGVYYDPQVLLDRGAMDIERKKHPFW